MKNTLILGCLFLLLGLQQSITAQTRYTVEGNGLYRSSSSTNLDIYSEDDNTNSLIRLGDNSSSKVSLGYNGNNDYFNISTAATLGADDFIIDLNGRIGVNIAATDHRLLIQQNSTSGISGDAHLTLQESNGNDSAKMRFTNLGNDSHWEVRSSAHNGAFQTDFYYTDDNNNDAVFFALSGDEEGVGIHSQAPEGYLHLKQQFAGLDALAFTNDNNTNKWSMRIGDEDILIYFNGGIRGGFDVSTGNYNNFPPAPALSGQTKMKDRVLEKVMQLQAVLADGGNNTSKIASFNPYEIEEIDEDWVVRSKDGQTLGIDYLEFSVLALKAIQEQQKLIEQQARKIAELKDRKALRMQRLVQLEELMK